MQNRGADDDDARKFRITVELRQILKNYAAIDGGAPVGELGRSCVVVGGTVHARLDNISVQPVEMPASKGKTKWVHVWVEDEEFKVAGKTTTRKSGEDVGGVMAARCELRLDRPDLFKYVEVVGCVGGCMDGCMYACMHACVGGCMDGCMDA